ncbi:MAG: DoxX family protein [Bacteroidetes bacterium]|nr:DoxX family protein [Bacteroidota bacterium]
MDQIFSIPEEAVLLIRIGLAAFFSILFVQSGLDKLINFRENLSYIASHFERTSISGFAPILFVLLTITEVLAGFISVYGIFELLIHDSSGVARIGALLSMLALLFVFFGQRIAKDYGGASGITGYFLVSVLAVVIFS